MAVLVFACHMPRTAAIRAPTFLSTVYIEMFLLCLL
jgi:hypothetical protein